MVPDVVCKCSLMIIGEVFVDDPTVIELGLLVKAIDDGISNEVVADSLSKVVAYGIKTSGPDTLNVKFRLLFIRSASKTSPPVTLNTVVFADIPRFPVAAPAAVLERITTAEDELFVEVMVVVPPPQALNSIVRWPAFDERYSASICICPAPELMTDAASTSIAVGRSVLFAVAPAPRIVICPPAE
jgi:hypothetical protein